MEIVLREKKTQINIAQVKDVKHLMWKYFPLLDYSQNKPTLNPTDDTNNSDNQIKSSLSKADTLLPKIKTKRSWC